MEQLTDALLMAIRENRKIIDKKLQQDPSYYEKLLEKISDDISDQFCASIKKIKGKNLQKTRRRENGFRNRLYKTWHATIDNLEVLIELCSEYAISLTETFEETIQKEDNPTFFALKYIQARVLLLSRECLALIKHGFPDGAFCLWRTMYELSTIGTFLYDKQDTDLSQRYIDYYYIQAYNDERGIREHGDEFHTDNSFKNLKANYNSMLDKYGKNFKKGYGWASTYFHRTGDRSKVNFKDIVDETGMDRLYGYYQSSSTYIHGNHKANEESLGLIPNLDKVVLIGPSNYGLSLPIQNVAISLVSITQFFLLTQRNLDTIVACRVLDKLLEKTLRSADKVQVGIEKREHRLQGIYPNVLVTAFKGKRNSSALLLSKIRANNADYLELTNSSVTSEKELKNKIDDKGKFNYIIAFGQKPESDKPTIEIASHKNSNSIKTNFQTNELHRFLIDNNIEVDFSNNAGEYLCDNIYHCGQKYIQDNNLDIKMILIYLPPIKSNFDFDKFARVISNYIDLLNDVAA